MQRRTWSLIAIPAVLGAMAITVPALAGTGSSPKARTARARHCTAVIVISHHRRVRACLIQGPRGFTGFPGPKGATGSRGPTGKPGKNGTNGTNGTNGAAGAPGTARAYAVITPSATVVSAQSFDITLVTSPKSGVYCITPSAPINPSTDAAAVSAEVSYSTPEAPGLVALNAQRKNCATSAFEVDTYAPGTLTLAGGYAFTIVIP
jgi:Collagen triple helix repeat (20 copies)